MKKLLVILAAAATIISCAPKGGYTITGNIRNLEGTSIELLDEYGDVINSATVNKGKFKMSGELTEPMAAYLSDDMGVIAMIFLENGKIRVESDQDSLSSIRVSGTLSNERNSEFASERSAVVERYYKAADEEEREAILAEDEANALAVIDSNLDNFFGLYMLTEMTYGWSGQQTLDKLAQFAPEIQATTLAADIRSKAEAQMRTDIGRQYTDVSLPDTEGSVRTVSSLIGPGKYVLIDFWASWCHPCMEEVPYLKAAYKKYSAKGFEIYGISSDRSNSDWLGAVEKHEMNWVQVIASGDDGRKPLEDYSVSTIPSNFLIGPDGTIIAKNLRGKEVEAKLAELLAK